MKLGIILPYSEEHIENFINHFEATVEGDYKLVFMKQKSNRPLNKGKLFNIGYSLHKNIFDYFCFHDINLIPISADCNYSYEEKPISLVGMRNKIKFGDQETIQNFEDYTLPYDEYFGGVTLISKEHFQKINGYSNNYWGVGYEDYDLLLRCVVKGLPVRKELEKEVIKTYGKFNGYKSCMVVDSNNAKIKNATNKSFTMSSWFYVEDEPPHSADTNNNSCEYSIFMRPGYHTGLSYTHGGFLKAVIWNRKIGSSDRKPTTIQVPLKTKKWYHVGMVVDDKNQLLYLYVDGKEVGKQKYEGELIQYLNKPYYIGVGDTNSSSWRNFFKGQISEVGLWSDVLENYEMDLIYNKGITSKGEFSISKIPIGFWDFKCGYDNIAFDMSGNNNHAKFHNVNFSKKSLKNNTERYLPYRRNGAYGYLSSKESYIELNNLYKSTNKDVVANRNTFNKKVVNEMGDTDSDGLSSTRFRIVKRENYRDKHEIIEVLI
tara:strand:+ start:242 stop:1705 length:1464 start_codon:yes stop_codon:yes gene_type:complete